jgi:cob(I)alamin adenosyltransferase
MALNKIQDRLFTIGAILASDPEKKKLKLPDLKEDDVNFLESEIDQMEGNLPELKNFIIPGGHPVVSAAHIARTVCRRAERTIVLLSVNSSVDAMLLEYINRLSDYLFVLGRHLAKELKAKEIAWRPSE